MLRFTEVCVQWLARVLALGDADGDAALRQRRALAIYAAIQGAQLVARGRDDLALFDRIIASYRVAGLVP